MFHNFANSLMSGLVKHRSILLDTSTFNLVILHFGWSIRGKCSLTQVCGWERGGHILIICSYFNSLLISCFLKVKFLKGCLLCVLWNCINELFILYTFKSIRLSCTLNVSFPRNFISKHWSFRNYWIPNVVKNCTTTGMYYVDPPSVDILHYISYQTITSCISKCHQKSQEIQSHGDAYKFLKIRNFV